jgi:NADH-quinone oxidoreductase subunit H
MLALTNEALISIEAFVKIALLMGGLMTGAAYFVLLERWIAAWVQDRKGPNRVGIPFTKIKLFGLGQPLADGLKFIFKEEHTPKHVDKILFTLAPISILSAALAVYACIPFGSVLPKGGIPGLGADKQIELLVAPGIDVGMIYIFALSSIAVYGVILGGWASNSKYSLIGGLRSSAQLIAYELPMGLSIIGVVLMTGSLRLEDVIGRQATDGWFAFQQPLGFVIFVVASFAEAARLPFDLPEAEQELVGGYHTEYAGMRLIVYLIAEFLHMITASFLIVILFLGGWHFWGVTGTTNDVTWFEAIARIVVLNAKIFLVIVFFMMIRWSWPRFRFDQLMSLAWKVMLPLGLVNLVAVACWVEYDKVLTEKLGSLGVTAAMWGLSILAWIAAGILAPLHSDNSARKDEFVLAAERRNLGLRSH